MKMVKPKLTVIRFDTEDVIATSGVAVHSVTGMLGAAGSKLTCPNDHSDEHFYFLYSRPGGEGREYVGYDYNADGNFNAQFSYLDGYNFANASALEANHWYYGDHNGFFSFLICGSGQ